MGEQGKLFVGGLPADVAPEELEEVFSGYGAIANVKILGAQKSSSGQACAFVIFEDQRSAEDAIEALDGTSAVREGGQAIRVAWARGGGPGGKQDARGGGGGGGAPRLPTSRRGRSRSPPPALRGGGGYPHRDAGNGIWEELLGKIERVASEMPEGGQNEEYSIMCELPSHKVSAMIGRHGDNIKHVRRVTGAKIHFSHDGGAGRSQDSQQELTIQGPPLSIYRAHAMLMTTYHEDEARRQHHAAAAPAPAAAQQSALADRAAASAGDDPDDPWSEVQELQRKLEAAKRKALSSGASR